MTKSLSTVIWSTVRQLLIDADVIESEPIYHSGSGF